jgi:hypothetical protein
MLTIMRVEDLIAKKDTELSEGPVCNVCDGAQDPVTARTRNSRCVRIREISSPMDNLVRQGIDHGDRVRR